jgi:hypothetical protein
MNQQVIAQTDAVCYNTCEIVPSNDLRVAAEPLQSKQTSSPTVRALRFAGFVRIGTANKRRECGIVGKVTAAVSILLYAAVPFSPSAVALIDARPDHVARFAAAHELAEPVQWTVAREIVAASYRSGIPPSVALAVGWRESRFFPGVVSSTGDLGPLQVSPYWTPEIVEQTTAQRIATGVRILAEAYRACGSWAGADQKYRSGRCR